MNRPMDLLVACDLDGTLLPFDRRQADWPQERDALPAFCARLAVLGVVFACVTGRRAASARRALGGAAWVVGLHGAEELRPGAQEPVGPAVPDAAAEPLAALADALRTGCPPAMHVEDKGLILTVHHPGLTAEQAAAALGPLVDRAGRDGLVAVTGRGWTELRAPGLPDKGAAVTHLVQRTRPGHLVVAGDDDGDAAMFDAADRLVETGVITRAHRVYVRPPGPARAAERLADVVLDSPRACREWILGFASTMEGTRS